MRDTLPLAERGNAKTLMKPLKMIAKDIFIRGLPPSIARAVDARDPEDMETAYEIAVRIETKMDARILPDDRYPKIKT